MGEFKLLPVVSRAFYLPATPNPHLPNPTIGDVNP
jgi:hypothetical protein